MCRAQMIPIYLLKLLREYLLVAREVLLAPSGPTVAQKGPPPTRTNDHQARANLRGTSVALERIKPPTSLTLLRALSFSLSLSLPLSRDNPNRRPAHAPSQLGFGRDQLRFLCYQPRPE